MNGGIEIQTQAVLENNKDETTTGAIPNSNPPSTLLPHSTFQSPEKLLVHRNYPRRSWTFPPSRRSQNYTIAIDDPILEKGKGWDTSPVVLKDFRLIFFTTPKIGTTVFKQLFRRMMGHELWPLEDINIPHNPQWNGLQYLYDFSLDQVHEMLTSPHWTRAIFVRDPLERLLSAYLDKAVRQKGAYVKRHCCGIKNDNSLSKVQAEQQVQEQQEQIRQYFRQKQEQQKQKDQQEKPKHQLQEPHQKQRANNHRGMNILLANSLSHPKGPPPQQQQQQQQRRQLQAMDMRVLNRLRSDAALQAMMNNNNNNNNNTPRPHSVPEGVPLPTICTNLTMETAIDWSTFVHDLLPTCSIDPHWKTQVIPSLPWINFVGHFDSLHADTRRLLERVGAWDRYGATGWPGGPIFQENTAQHKTSSRELMTSYYANSTIRQTVLQFYHQDYENEILNLTRPKFIPDTPDVE